MNHLPRIAVVIPAYKVRAHIMAVIDGIESFVEKIYVVDDCCPESTGDFVRQRCTDTRVKVIVHPVNLGVGGAVISGYKEAISDRMDIVVKVDGDGQMDPKLIVDFVSPILSGEADYTKGNRFFDLASLSQMPRTRLIGNAGLSFMNKLSSGYWDLFDPTNGYTAIHCEVLSHLPLDKISQRYFFESDMLFRLSTLRAVVFDIPMDSKYGEEVSSLKIGDVLGEFFIKNIRNFGKRVFYNYYLRDLSVASFELPLGIALLAFGVTFGTVQWTNSLNDHVAASAGTVMLAGLPILLGLQFILAFLSHDMRMVPKRPFHRAKLRLKALKKKIGENDAD
jgi:dolichol-phosphate mannosyltransferase